AIDSGQPTPRRERPARPRSLPPSLVAHPGAGPSPASAWHGHRHATRGGASGPCPPGRCENFLDIEPSNPANLSESWPDPGEPALPFHQSGVDPGPAPGVAIPAPADCPEANPAPRCGPPGHKWWQSAGRLG